MVITGSRPTTPDSQRVPVSERVWEAGEFPALGPESSVGEGEGERERGGRESGSRVQEELAPRVGWFSTPLKHEGLDSPPARTS